jgi:hypothetical protein
VAGVIAEDAVVEVSDNYSDDYNSNYGSPLSDEGETDVSAYLGDADPSDEDVPVPTGAAGSGGPAHDAAAGACLFRARCLWHLQGCLASQIG